MANLDKLYPESRRQQAFVDHKNGMLVSLAGPGTGKTYSFLLRIKELTENRRIDSSSICYLTFNGEIALAFKKDLHQKYPGSVLPQHITASTLHSFACRLIRNKGYKIELDGHLHMLNLCEKDDPVAKIAVSDMMFALPQNAKIRTVPIMRKHLKPIKEGWQNGNSVKSLVGDTALVERTYQTYSRAFKLLDWDEVIPLATSLYSDKDDRPAWIKKYQHLLIDEYQDFNMAEQVFLRLISASVASCVVVGDDDQSIYSGRGASPSGIRELVQDPGVNSIGLVECRIRPPEQIIQAVNRFLSFMHTNPRHLKAVIPGGVVAIKSFKSAVAEVDYLVGQIKGVLGQINENTHPDDGIVCLFPSKRVLSQYRDEFENRGLKCKFRDSSSLPDAKMWVRILGRLAFQHDQPFLERMVLERFTDFKPLHKKAIVLALQNGHASVKSVLSSIASSSSWSGQVLDAISRYNAFIKDLVSRDATLVAACIDSVLTDGEKCDPSYVDNFLATADDTNLEDALDILIAQIYRADDIAGKAKFEPSVELLTLHSSKGLTRRYVILPGLEQSWLPGNATADVLEERKRLFLVGITRSKKLLLITYPRTRAPGDTLNFPIAGRHQLSGFAEQLGITREFV